MSSRPLWKAAVVVPKEVAADVAAAFELTPPRPQSVLISENPFEKDATVEALYDTAPSEELLSRVCERRVCCEPLPDQNWIRLSLEGLPPVRAGRFFLYGAHDAGIVPRGVIPLRIEAGLAFGTGHHESTALCLEALCRLSKARRFARILDIGCGTGVLAIAAAKLWHGTVSASDIDPVAADTARANALNNGAAPEIHVVRADGLDHPTIRASAPYDLICANILAGPLTRLAPGIAKAARRGGTVLLSGLLRDQEKLVLSFYHAQKLVFCGAIRSGPWSALLLNKPSPAGGRPPSARYARHVRCGEKQRARPVRRDPGPNVVLRSEP